VSVSAIDPDVAVGRDVADFGKHGTVLVLDAENKKGICQPNWLVKFPF
jgi:hypothetical protein